MKTITPQEQRVLELISSGHSTGQIAYALNISPHTVETHRKNLLGKFDAKNAADMVRKAMELRILSIGTTDKNP